MYLIVCSLSLFKISMIRLHRILRLENAKIFCILHNHVTFDIITVPLQQFTHEDSESNEQLMDGEIIAVDECVACGCKVKPIPSSSKCWENALHVP